MAKFEPKPFGKYFLTDRIAIGGMAEIYKAKTFGVDGFEKVLAIKKILSHYSADKEFITMLTDEAKLVVNLSHANIVQVYDLGRVGDDYFISMEFIDGINLRDLIQVSQEMDEPIPIDIALFIISEVCRGLDYAHNKKDNNGKDLKIIHRDISPQNILVSYDGGVKIVDFGIAKAALNLSQTHAGILKGKVNYMAPEQAFGKPMDGRSDLFSLGIVLYELLTNKRLFKGETQMEILKKIRNEKITEDYFGDEIPAFLKPILAKTLAYTAAKRYKSAADLQIELTRILYTTYNDFSPRKTIDLLNKWFSDRKEYEKQDEDPDHETILVSATQNEENNQINLVHGDSDPDSTVQQPLDKIINQETISPDDHILPYDIEETKEEATEKSRAKKILESPEIAEVISSETDQTERTEKSEITQPKETIEEMLQRVESNRHQTNQKATVIIIVLFVILSVLGFYLFHVYETKIMSFFGVENNQTKKHTNVVPVQKVVVQEKANIKIVSQPEGADIWLNGKQTELKTPANLSGLDIKKIYQVRLTKEGYNEASQKFILFEKENAPIEFDLILASSPTYKLEITSEPAGANIYLNTKNTGYQTPHIFELLEVGKEYSIDLRKQDYEDFNQVLLHKEKTDKKITARLKAVPKANLVITSEPEGADIYVDGQLIPYKTPYEFNELSFPKTVVVTIKKSGYLDLEKKITLNESKDYQLEYKLEKIIKKVLLKVSSNISGAEVYINNKLSGLTPFKKDLEEGDYTVVVKKSGYDPKTQKITLNQEKSKQNKVYFKLNKQVSTKTVATPTTPGTTKPPVKDPYSAFPESNKNVSKYAKLRVDSTPSGASVSINGQAKGITPIVVGGLPKNTSLSVSVSKKGYRTWIRSVRLSKDRLEIRAVLSP